MLKVHPKVKLIMAIASPAVPGAAEAVKQSGRTDVKVTGLSLPNMCKPYVHEGVIDSIVLWNTIDLGYLTVYTARALARGELAPGARKVAAGRLGEIEVIGDQVMLGAPFVFTGRTSTASTSRPPKPSRAPRAPRLDRFKRLFYTYVLGDR